MHMAAIAKVSDTQSVRCMAPPLTIRPALASVAQTVSPLSPAFGMVASLVRGKINPSFALRPEETLKNAAPFPPCGIRPARKLHSGLDCDGAGKKSDPGESCAD